MSHIAIVRHLLSLSMLFNDISRYFEAKGWLAIAKLKPLSLVNSQLLMLKKAFDNVKIEK